MFQKFIFNGASSDSYNIMAVSFDGADTTLSLGSTTETKQERVARSNQFYMTSQQYSEPIQFTMQIINKDGSEISIEKQRSLTKWLCHRGQYHWMQINEDGRLDYCYHVNISNPRAVYYGRVIGMEFTVTSDAPYAYTPLITKHFSTTLPSQSFPVLISTDDDDYIYPTMEFVPTVSGTLNITNSTELVHRQFQLRNVLAGEMIVADSMLPIISSSRGGHNVYADFNKNWLRFVSGTNRLTINLHGTMTLTYREVRKVGVL